MISSYQNIIIAIFISSVEGGLLSTDVYQKLPLCSKYKTRFLQKILLKSIHIVLSYLANTHIHPHPTHKRKKRWKHNLTKFHMELESLGAITCVEFCTILLYLRRNCKILRWTATDRAKTSVWSSVRHCHSNAWKNINQTVYDKAVLS